MSYNNRFIYEVGNPLLTPATYHNLQLSTLYRWLQFSISYQYPFMLFAPKLTYSKRTRPDSRRLSLTVSYRINSNSKAYKGKHVSDKDMERL